MYDGTFLARTIILQIIRTSHPAITGGGGGLLFLSSPPFFSKQEVLYFNSGVFFLVNKNKYVNQILYGMSEGNRKYRNRWENIIKIDLMKLNVDWMHLAQDRVQWWTLVKRLIKPSSSINGREWLDRLTTVELLKLIIIVYIRSQSTSMSSSYRVGKASVRPAARCGTRWCYFAVARRLPPIHIRGGAAPQTPSPAHCLGTAWWTTGHSIFLPRRLRRETCRQTVQVRQRGDHASYTRGIVA